MRNLFDEDNRFLSDNEVIYNVTNNKVTTDKVNKILRDGDYVSIDEICSYLTPARRAMALAVIELYKRLQERKECLFQIRNSEHIYKLMKGDMIDLHVEECWAIYLNQSAKVIRKECISKGGLASTIVDIRVILRGALKYEATSMVLVHNHPSCNIHPSLDDDRLTKSLAEGAKAINVKLLDHVIVAGSAYYSYADEGRL